MSKYLVNIVLCLVGFAALLFIVRILTTDGNGKGGVGTLPQSILSAAEQPSTTHSVTQRQSTPQAPPVKEPDKEKDKPKASDKDPRVCTHCICGCVETGKCDCKDCDHPKLAPPEKKQGTDGGAGDGGKKVGSLLSYADGYQTALDNGKPLIVWVGGFRCPSCTEELTNCVHCQSATWPPTHSYNSEPCCVVAKPSGGELYRCGTITGMCSADKIKGLLANGGNATRGANSCPGGYCDVAGQCGVGGCSAGAGCSTCGNGPSGGYGYGYGTPQMSYGPSFGGYSGGFGSPVMMGGGGGGCASGNCGGGGGRRGR